MATLAPPDFEGPFTAVHRRDAATDTDIYFVAGTGPATMTFRVVGRPAELWDAVTGDRWPVAAVPTADGRTQVALELPRDGAMFVVFRGDGTVATSATAPAGGGALVATRLPGPWQVSFSYHPGIAAAPPAARTLPALVDWTTVDDLKYFAGTAVYRTKATLSAEDAARMTTLSLGKVPSGLASVKVNGVDCGVVWCAPWEADISAAVRAGENAIEVRYTNNGHNRLVGDCFLKPETRVTRSTLSYATKPRERSDPKRPGLLLPTVYSGPSLSDPLQPSGLIGPVQAQIGGR